MNIKAGALLAVAAALAVILTASPALAQTASTGAVLGTVTDPTGAIVPSADVELTNPETGAKATTRTGAQGQFAFPVVSPGVYTVTAKAQRFRTTTVGNVNVQVNASTTVNFKLELGEVSTRVEVTASQAQLEMQTADSTMGDVVGSQALLRLPTRLRQAQELLLLQPGTTPQTGSDNGASIAGAVNDQTTFTLDGIDISDNSTNSTINSDQGSRPVLMVSVESTDEFRIAIANSNATFTRASGGQVSMIERSGTNQLHGAAFWYTQNSDLNANTWDNNRLNLGKPHVEDNRWGGRVGGPIIRDKTFFFAEYEARRYPENFLQSVIVPTNTLKQGILRFQDASGNIVSYNLGASAMCGSTGNQPCDPRGLGISPTMKAMMALEPTGNNPSISGVDNLNTTGFTANAKSPLTDDFGTFKLDHVISEKWRFSGSFNYSRDLSYDPSPLVLDIRNANDVLNDDQTPSWTAAYIAGLTGQLSPTMVDSFRFGFVENRNGGLRPQLSAIATELGLPGTESSDGYVAVSPNVFTAPITMSNSVRTQFNNNKNLQFGNDLNWTKSTHLLQFGANFERLPNFHFHTGKVGGSVNSLNATTTADSSFLVLSASDRPPTCSASLTTNCLLSSAVSTWDSLYTTTLGMMNDDNVFLVRNGQLQAQPFGTALDMNALSYSYAFYGQDTWRIRPSLTLNYGLSYSWQTPFNFSNQNEMLTTDAATGQIISPAQYLKTEAADAAQGVIYNSTFAFVPVRGSGHSSVYNTDYGDVAPRVALAWNPSAKNGLAGKLLGDKKTVVRGGFGMYYSRLSSESSVVSPGLTAGFSSSITTGLTNCAASGAGGAGCNTASADPAASTFRFGVDGSVPVPTYAPTITSPYIPAGNYSELVSFGIDDNIKMPRIYTSDFTIQRSLARGLFFEAAWNGRYGRSLFANAQISASPYMFKDTASGQTFAQAYDAVSNQLRAGQTVTAQPWFENQLPGVGVANNFASTTGYLANHDTSYFTLGDVSSLFDSTSSSTPGLNILRTKLGLPAYNENQINEPLEVMNLGWSNYNALVLTLRHSGTHFTCNFNYTFSRSLDTYQGVQNDSSTLPNPLYPASEYGPSKFDHTHIFNGLFVYSLPEKYSRLPAALNKVVGGWRVSGIIAALSGPPVFVTESSQDWGGGQRAGLSSAAVPLVAASSLGTGLHSGVTSSGGIGTGGNPATGGSGLNLFANPQSAYSDFGYIQLNSGTDGYAHPLRGLPFWNVDSSFGKKIAFTEHKSLDISFDFFNLFNNVNFANPSMPLTGSLTNFGVISATLVPANRQASSRWIMIGTRFEF